MSRPNDYIAVFDSGVGGISVLKELVRQLPQERFLYFGDSANAPYGSRPTEQVRQLTLDAAQMLLDRGIKALVVACNTATAAAIEILRQTYPELIVIGIEPALKVAADRFPQGCIGVMATEVTLREEKFHQQAERYPDIRLHLIPAPGLVELIESGNAESAEAYAMAEKLLAPYAGKLDALVLGCTHYPFAKKAITRALGEKTILLDGSEGTARQTRRRLEQAGLLYEGPGEVQMENSSAKRELLTLSMALLEQKEMEA